MFRKRFLLNLDSGELHDTRNIRKSNCYMMFKTILTEHKRYMNGKEVILYLFKMTESGKQINGCKFCMKNIDNG